MNTQLVGILNLTPDSFSDGGAHAGMAMVERAVGKMAAQGVAAIDVGAESTRPGATPVPPAEEMARLQPFMEEIMTRWKNIPFSIDTRNPETAVYALSKGAAWINDVSGLADPDMIAAVKAARCTVIVMHSVSVPADPAKVMQSEGIKAVDEVLAFGKERIAQMEDAGIARERIIFDPGIGFGKNIQQSLAVLRNIARFRKELGVPVLVGHSRKSFLKAFSAEGDRVRDEATLAFSACLAGRGVEYLRVHNVEAHARMLSVVSELEAA